MSENEEIQKKYLTLQEIEQQLKQFQQQLLLLNQQIVEALSLAQHLEDLGNVPSKSNAYTSVGSGIFVASTLEDTGHLLVNVGAGIFVKKTVAETREMLLQQAEHLKTTKKSAEEELHKLAEQGKKLQNELKTLVAR